MPHSEFKPLPDTKPGQIWRTKAGGLYEIKPYLTVLPFDLVGLVQDEHGFKIWHGGGMPMEARGAEVTVRHRDGSEYTEVAGTFRSKSWRHVGTVGDIVAYKVVEAAAEAPVPPPAINAIAILEAAAGHMRDRAATYDKPEGERSMVQTVAAFNAITGRNLAESEGWLLMDLLKLTRLFARPAFHRDSAEDHVAYGALLAEARAKETGEKV